MESSLKSKWQHTQVELLKRLHEYRAIGVDEEVGSVDYIAESEDDKKLLRVIIGPKFNASRAVTKTIGDTIMKLEEEECNKAILMASGFTDSSKKMIRKDVRLEMISPNSKYHSINEISMVIQKATRQYCGSKCESLPTTEKDCVGLVDGNYSCEVRRISDDAEFHAQMGWRQLLKKDFTRLLNIQPGG